MLTFIEKPSGEMPNKLNFGCGSQIQKEQVNLDISIPIRGLTPFSVDCWVLEGEITSPHDLPKNHFKIIYATMCLEHIHLDHIPNTLYCLYEFLQSGGILKIIVPNFRAIAQNYMATADDDIFDLTKLKALREITYQLLDPTLESGASARGHQSLWTPELAYYWLSSEGYNPISIKPLNKWAMEITATKPRNNPYSIGSGL